MYVLYIHVYNLYYTCIIPFLQEIEHQTVGLQSILSRQESVLKEFLVYCKFENDMEQVWNGDQTKYRAQSQYCAHTYNVLYAHTW